eukprot:310748-Chlamydomonas_euryale.AAC.1
MGGRELAPTVWALSRLAAASGQEAVLLDGAAAGGGATGCGVETGTAGVAVGSWLWLVLESSEARMKAGDLTPQGVALLLLACGALRARPPP